MGFVPPPGRGRGKEGRLALGEPSPNGYIPQHGVHGHHERDLPPLDESPDRQAQARIAVRLDRAADGNFGDHRSVGQGVSELRINVAQGYRVYYTIRDTTLVILLCGGDTASQQQDIHRALRMARAL